MLPSQLRPHKHFSNANASLTILLTLPSELPDASLTTPSQLPYSFFPINMQIILLTVRANEQLAKRELTALTAFFFFFFFFGGGGGGGCPTKVSEKSSMIIPWLLQNPNFHTKKYQYLFLRSMYQFVESITAKHRRTLTHRQTHDLIKDNRLFSWFY